MTGGRALGSIGLGAALAVALLRARGSDAFVPYFGPLDPLLVTLGVFTVGLGCLRYLESRSWLVVDRTESGRRRYTTPAHIAALLTIPVVAVDMAGGFPPTINVLPPDGLLFYPAIALVAEVVFHVLPATAVLIVLSRFVRGWPRDRLLVAGLVVAALPEPIFQVIFGLGESPWWASAYVAVHLLVFNVVELVLFRRYGFLSMYALRLTYYLFWHVLWGVLRLRLIF